jgi:hypothetical protein
MCRDLDALETVTGFVDVALGGLTMFTGWVGEGLEGFWTGSVEAVLAGPLLLPLSVGGDAGGASGVWVVAGGDAGDAFCGSVKAASSSCVSFDIVSSVRVAATMICPLGVTASPPSKFQ